MPKVGFSVGTGVSSVNWELYNASNVYQTGGTMNNGGAYTWTRDAGWYVKITSVSPYSNYTTPYYYTRTDGYVQNLSNDNIISFSNSVTTKEGTITATQKAAPSTYTLTYNLDGGTGDSSTQTKTHGINITLHGAPTKTGYDFQYWQDQTNYSTWAAGANFTENRSTTFKAIWTRKTYTVSYNANGGTGAPSAQTKTYGIDLTLSSTKPTWTGHIFVNWFDGTDYYAPGGTYTANSPANLYAQWKDACTLFYWHGSSSADSLKFASGKSVKDALTATAWNNAIDKTNEIRQLLGQSESTIPKVTAGSQITAVTFNQLRVAIGTTIGAGTVPASVSKGDAISISLFIGNGSLREALNTAINNYNNS